jgi:hypothetical protein
MRSEGFLRWSLALIQQTASAVWLGSPRTSALSESRRRNRSGRWLVTSQSSAPAAARQSAIRRIIRKSEPCFCIMRAPRGAEPKRTEPIFASASHSRRRAPATTEGARWPRSLVSHMAGRKMRRPAVVRHGARPSTFARRFCARRFIADEGSEGESRTSMRLGRSRIASAVANACSNASSVAVS